MAFWASEGPYILVPSGTTHHRQSTFQHLITKSYTPVRMCFTGSYDTISKLKSLKQILQHKNSISFEISY